jgi:serine protease
MSRCLHITINDHAGAGPRSATANLSNPIPGYTDPGGNVVMPPVDGGGSTDPGGNLVMPPVDGGRLIFSGAGAGTPATNGAVGETVQVGSCACACTCAVPACACPSGATAASTALPYGVSPGDWSGFVIVRLHEGVVADSPAETLWALAELHTPKLKGLEAVLEIALDSPLPEGADHLKRPPAEPAGVLRSRPLVELRPPARRYEASLTRAECLNLLRDLEKKAATTAFPPLHSLTAYWRLDLREHPDLADEAMARLNRLAEVDLAYKELRANDPQLTAAVKGQVFAEDQGYLDDAPIGIGAAWAWKQLVGTPPTVTVCDLEQGWNLAHNDLAAESSLDPAYGANRSKDEPNPGHHGTAVLGQLAAAGTSTSAPSVRGEDAQLGQFLLTSHYREKNAAFFPGTNGHVAAAIVQVLLPASSPLLKPGDVLLLEVQQGLLPTEIDEANFDAIRLATALRVIVVEAAGNGGFDLDRWRDPGTGRSLNRGDAGFRDSGAIVVGAARAGLPHDRASFSNYGSRVDCFSWGEAVTTCGFGDLAGTGAADFYTNQFDGTSSASPVIAGAVALVQSLHQAQTGTRLEPWAMRSLLADPATGTPQGPNVAGRIGVMPNLRAIVRDALQLVPDVYMRRSPGDGGSPPASDDEISSSPDILIWNGRPAASTQFGEGSLREDQPAPGDPVSSAANSLYVRLRNRGLGAGDADVRLFASPAATLITPERWIPVGSISANQIPQGDQLAVSGPVSWTPPTGSTDPFWSFLAVLPDEDLPAPLGPPYFPWSIGLPPGPPYFDWAEFRAFLRKPGVAWRNAHRVATASSHTLPFIIAGTPDQARAFDFEVIQRLPENAKVELQVAPALEAKLRQRQQWPGGMLGKLSLPQKPRTTFNHVQLATGTRAPGTFLVTAANDPLTVGHSLALRQLWHGEEVGRITWWFGLAG